MNAQNGDALVVGAAALAIQLAKGLSPEQLDALAAFFNSLADNLALIAGQLPQNQ